MQITIGMDVLKVLRWKYLLSIRAGSISKLKHPTKIKVVYLCKKIKMKFV